MYCTVPQGTGNDPYITMDAPCSWLMIDLRDVVSSSMAGIKLFTDEY